MSNKRARIPTLHEFALAALPGVAARPDTDSEYWALKYGCSWDQAIARVAYDIAEAMQDEAEERQKVQ